MNNDEREHQIQTVDERGEAIPERLPTIDAAQALYDSYKRANIEVAKADAKVIALHRGKAPYKQEELTALGQGWRANLNMREMKGAINNRADLAYDLHMDLDTRITVTVRPDYREQGTPNPQLDYGRIIAEEYTHTVSADWADNYLFVDQTSRDRIKLGLGIGAWLDHMDWRPKPIPKLSFKTNPEFPPLADSVPACCIDDTLRIQDLLRVVRNADASEKAGWNVDEVKTLIIAKWHKTEGNDDTQPAGVRDGVLGGYAAFEQWMTERPGEAPVFELEKIDVVHHLIRATDSEEISHYIKVEETTSPYTATDFLFKKLNQFDKMSQALWLNPYTFSEGTIGSLDGLGHDLAPYAEISNRMMCSALDGSMMSGGLLLQATTGFDADETSVIRMGPTTLIPAGVTPVQNRFQPPVENILGLRSAVRGVFSNNVGMTRMNPELMESASQGTKSREQVITERNRDFRLETNSANFEYLMWTGFHREVFRRLVAAAGLPEVAPGAKAARAFYRRCLSRGVPPALLEQHEEALIVEVNRTVGDGAPQSRTQIWGQMMQLRGAMDEAGRKHTEREYTASLIGYRNVDQVFPISNRDQIPTNALSVATLENNDFMEGRYVPAGTDQLHTIHLQQAHFKLLLGMVETYNEAPEQTDVDTLLKTFSAALPHCNEHLQMLSQDPTRKDFVQSGFNTIKELIVFYQRVEKEAQENAAERQQLLRERQEGELAQLRSDMEAETVARLREVELEAELETMRQDSLASIRQQKTDAQNAIKAAAADASQQLKRDIAERDQSLKEEVAIREQDRKDRTQ